MINYYLVFYPGEALIASELEPHEFGMYMARGSKKGSAEQLMFAKIWGEFGSYFDWEFAKERCVSHSDGEPKHSLYLSIYRVLEHIPLDVFQNIYLVTMDGRVLELVQRQYLPQEEWRGFGLYKELCPVHPLIVSSLQPKELANYIIHDKEKRISVPALIFSDIKVIDFDDLEHTGNIGMMYDRDLDHLKDCINSLTKKEGKLTKTVDRSFEAKFSYQIIEHGLYVASGNKIIYYPMLSKEELREYAYDWGKSANIL